MHENVWSPWRYAYLQDLERRRDAAGEGPHEAEDFLATYWASPELDAEHRVIFRDDRGIILLNRYPYANGHLLVGLGVARPRLLDHTPAERAAFWGLVEIATDLVERTFQPHGVNLGVNQGDAAGAGLEDGVLHRFGMLFGDVETKLVDGHRASLADRPGSGGLAVVVGGLGQVRVGVAQLIVALG